jgi:hypothetical protein
MESLCPTDMDAAAIGLRRELLVGKLDKVFDEAPKTGWIVANRKKEWKLIDPFEK